MITSRSRRSISAMLALLFSLFASGFASGLHAEPSNKWRIEVNHSAASDGTIVLRISPTGRPPIDVETKIPARTGENRAAELLRVSLDASLGKEFHVERDDGEDVLIKKRAGNPDFDLTLVSSSVAGLSLELERE